MRRILLRTLVASVHRWEQLRCRWGPISLETSWDLACQMMMVHTPVRLRCYTLLPLESELARKYIRIRIGCLACYGAIHITHEMFIRIHSILPKCMNLLLWSLWRTVVQFTCTHDWVVHDAAHIHIIVHYVTSIHVGVRVVINEWLGGVILIVLSCNRRNRAPTHPLLMNLGTQFTQFLLLRKQLRYHERVLLRVVLLLSW